MSKKEQTERFFEFMKKWNFKDFEAFEKHYDYLMSLKNREQLMVENEAMKETIAELLGQKKTTTKELKQQLAEKDKEILEWKDGTMICNYEKMLAEKDKEIEYLKRKWSITKSYAKDQQEAHSNYFEENKKLKNQLKDQRHQICEEMKIKGYYYHNSRGEEYYEITPEMLWEIEKGE